MAWLIIMSDLISWQKKLYPVLWPISLLYGLGMRLRSTYWAHSSHTWNPPIPCISVGNISWGGTGKTPFCQYLLKLSLKHNLRPVILTRGYKARPPVYPHLVRANDDPKICGDEPLLLAGSHALAKVVVDPNRTRAGKWTLANLNPDLFILDDGFQHQKVHRHLNLVLFSPNDFLIHWNKVIPAGPWREQKTALNRADIFLINTWNRDTQALATYVARKLAPFNKPIFYFRICPRTLINLNTQTRQPHLNNEPYILVTGIANPKKVLSTITHFLGYPPKNHLFFPDHHHFEKKDFEHILQLAHNDKVKHIVCTTKDALKLKKFTYPYLLALEIEVQFDAQDEQRFEQIFLKTILRQN